VIVRVRVRVRVGVGVDFSSFPRNFLLARVDKGRMAHLDHENLDVYQRSLEFLALAFRILARLPRGEREVRDQLKRAAMSTPLNIAEGAGKPTVADRARFHAIARGSAMECSALLDVFHMAGWVPAAELDEGKVLLVRIVAMLTKMCRT
jgi:four helix bundle protein